MGTLGLLFSPVLTFLLVNTSIVIIIRGRVSEAMSTITAMAKDQISCTMCSSCDNPCQPVFSPPPPSPPPPSPPLPSPAPPIPESDCPPPPSLPPVSVSVSPPPLPSNTSYYPPLPPSCGGGGSGLGGPCYPSPGIIGPYPGPPPPNPMTPCFPFYCYSPPPPMSSSKTWRRNPTISSLIIIFLSLVFHM